MASRFLRGPVRHVIERQPPYRRVCHYPEPSERCHYCERICTLPSPPHISVIIPTRNRPEDVRRCLDSLTAVRYSSWDVLLVDQSDDDQFEQTERVVMDFAQTLQHMQHHRMSERGPARARNVGVEETSGNIKAFLDDDCTVQGDWLEQVAAAFARYPQAALVIGKVECAPYDPQEVLVPAYPIKKEHVIHGNLAFVRPDGAGAAMYMRRAVPGRVGLLDVRLGPGSPYFNGGEDNDFIYRCLVSGYSIVRAPSIIVTHYGAKLYNDGSASRLLLNNAYCAAAVDMKLLRCGYPVAFLVMASHILYFLVRFNARDVIARRTPSSLHLLTMYTRGLIASYRFGINRQRMLFTERHTAAAR